MKNKGYTLLETAISILMIVAIITAISIVYVNLIKSTVLASDYYQSLENVKLGSEKIWRILKYGWDFEKINDSDLKFKKYDCSEAGIRFNNNKLEYCEGNPCIYQSVFDENLVKVNNFLIATDTPNTDEDYYYFQYSPKIIILYYNLELKSKRGVTSTLEFEQAVAPLNSIYSRSSCKQNVSQSQ